MKTSCLHFFLSVILAAILATSMGVTAQEAPAPFTTPLFLQYEAMGKYPELARAGSPFNREFLLRVERARAERPTFFANPMWPLVLADEVAGATQKGAAHDRGQIPTTGTTAIGSVDWYAGHPADSFAKLAAAQQPLERYSLDFELLSAAIFHATNDARRSHGLRPLTYLPALRNAAWEHSMAMASQNFFSHYNSRDPRMATPALRVEAQGVSNMAVGENISSAIGSGHTYWSYARYVVGRWMNSPGHRANILREHYTHLGCGAHPCGCPSFHLLATQDFAFVTERRTITGLERASAPRPSASVVVGNLGHR